MSALITGTTSGIGFEFAKIFAKKGYDLVLIDKLNHELEKQREKLENEYNINVLTITKDLSLENACQEIFEETRRNNINIDILINNAGFGTFGRFTDISLNWQKDLLNVNMNSLMQLSYLFGREMIKNGKGKILNVASIAAFQPGPYMAMYYASKAFVLSFSEALYKEFKGTGVSVTAVCPGPTNTNFEKNAKMIDSLMFKKLKVDSPEFVARKGYKALMKNRVVYVCGWYNKLITFFTRFATEKSKRDTACYINIGKSKL